MSRIFLSHSSHDNFEAVALSEWLASEGWNDVFLDLDPERGIAAGERWERALHGAAMRCEAVMFLVSANWLDSGWCRREFELARGMNKKLFAALIDTSTTLAGLPPELTGVWQIVDLKGGQDLRLFPARLPGTHEERHVGFSASGLIRLKRGLQKAGLDPRFFAWPPEGDPGRAPYRGLKPLDAQDAGIFFGREAPIIEATDLLRRAAAGAPPRLFVILGASGAGKSSFLRAGLLSRLARDDQRFIVLAPIRPERAALTGENGLVAALSGVMTGVARADVRAAVQAGSAALRPLLSGLVRASLAQRVDAGDSSRSPAIVVAIDQAEELFRADAGRESEALLNILSDLASVDDPAVIVIFAIRSDSYDALERAKPIEGFRQIAFPLLPLPRGSYAEVIDGPARRVQQAAQKLVIEPRLTERLLADVEAGGGIDALPLLAFSLEQLYLDYHRNGVLRLEDYETSGGLRGAIDAAVERALVRADLDPRISRDRSERLALLRRGLIPWLAGVDPDSKTPRRNIARRSDIPAESLALIDLLVEERLLFSDIRVEPDVHGGGDIRIPTLEPAHEALLRQWSWLEDCLNEDFGLLTTLEGIKRAAREWDEKQRDGAWLPHRGARLADAVALDERPDIAAKLEPLDRAYLASCRARELAESVQAEARRREREEEQSRALRDARSLAEANRRRARAIAIGLVVAVAFAFATAWFGLESARQRGIAEQQKSVAEREATHAVAAEQVAQEQSQVARRNQAAGLAALSRVELLRNPGDAAKLALAAWPRAQNDPTPRLNVALDALSAAAVELREVLVLGGHAGPVRGASFSPDGQRVVTASNDKTARLWDVASGKTIAVLEGHAGAVTIAAFSSDGARIVTASADGTARVWDGATGAPLFLLSGHQGPVVSASFSGDGERIVTASVDASARVWDVTTGKSTTVLVGHRGPVVTAAFSADGKRVITASADRTARVWDSTSGQLMTILEGHEGPVVSAAFSPDGSAAVTASVDRTARIWNTANGAAVWVLVGHEDRVWSAAYSGDGARVVTASADGTARLWDATNGKPVGVLKGHLGAVVSAVFSSDGQRVTTASSDGTARIWDTTSGQPAGKLAGHTGRVFVATFSPDGRRILTGSADGTARLWNAVEGLPIASLSGQADRLWSAAFSIDGRHIVTAGGDGSASLWDAARGNEVARFSGHGDQVWRAAFSPDGARLVTASWDKTARVWDAATGRLLLVLAGHTDQVWSAAFSPDSERIVTASWDKTARIWDAGTGRFALTLQGHDGAVNDAAFSPDGAHVVTASSDLTARIWDSKTGATTLVLKGHTGSVTRSVYSHDGKWVVSASADGTARLWDAANGRAVEVFKGHEGPIASVNFSADDSRIVTASSDKSIRLWDISTGEPIMILRSQSELFNDANFSPDGRRLVTSAGSRTAQVWDISTLPSGNLFAIACARLPDRSLQSIVQTYELADIQPICSGSPPLPDLAAP